MFGKWCKKCYVRDLFIVCHFSFYAENKKRFSRLCDGGVIYYHHQQKINDNKDGDYMTDSEKLNLILEKVSNLDEKVSNLLKLPTLKMGFAP